jgi:hypothetical protein
MAGVLCRVVCANQGYIGEALILFLGSVCRRVLEPLCVLAITLNNRIKSQKNPKIANPILFCSG